MPYSASVEWIFSNVTFPKKQIEKQNRTTNTGSNHLHLNQFALQKIILCKLCSKKAMFDLFTTDIIYRDSSKNDANVMLEHDEF